MPYTEIRLVVAGVTGKILNHKKAKTLTTGLKVIECVASRFLFMIVNKTKT
jgi:hypothetical protein